MQIHELTSRRVSEGLMDTIKSAGQKAAKAFNDPASMGLTNNAKFATNQANARLDKATNDYVDRLLGQWATVSATSQPGTEYAQDLKAWANDKLKTKESNTGTPLNLVSVAKELPQAAASLETALAAVAKASNNPNTVQPAVKNYLTMAVKGIQQVATEIRNQNPVDDNGMPAYSPAGKAPGARPTAGGTGVATGYRYAVPYKVAGQETPSYYYKNSSGWRNEDDQAVDSPRTIEYLEKLLKQMQDTNRAKLEKDPLYVPPQAPKARKVSRKRKS